MISVETMSIQNNACERYFACVYITWNFQKLKSFYTTEMGEFRFSRVRVRVTPLS